MLKPAAVAPRDHARPPSPSLYRFFPGTTPQGVQRFGVLSVTRTAAKHLFDHVHDVHRFLKTNKASQWMTDHVKQILDEVIRQKIATAEANEQAAEHADVDVFGEIGELFEIDDDGSIPIIDCAYCASGSTGDDASLSLDECINM